MAYLNLCKATFSAQPNRPAKLLLQILTFLHYAVLCLALLLTNPLLLPLVEYMS